MAKSAKLPVKKASALAPKPHTKTVGGSKKIEAIIKQLREKGAKGLYVGADIPDVFKDRTPFDTFGLNVITGGGIPDNAITEIEGPPSTFKTTTAGGCIKQRQRMIGRKCVTVWLASENPPDKNWLRHLGTKIPYSDLEIERFKELGLGGTDLEFLVNEQEEGGMFILLFEQIEDSIDKARKLLSTGDVSILVFDSVGAVSARAEQEGGVGDAQVAANTRVVSKTTRLMQAEGNALTNEGAKTAVIYINQIRAKIGGYSPNPSVIPTDNPGGYTLKHGKVLQIKTKVVGTITEQSSHKVWAKEVSFRVEKSKICIPFRTSQTTFVLRADNPGSLPIGPDTSTEAFHLALDCGLITYVGHEWVYAGSVLELNGKPAAKNDIPLVLRADAQLLEAIKVDVLRYNQRLEIKGIA